MLCGNTNCDTNVIAYRKPYRIPYSDSNRNANSVPYGVSYNIADCDTNSVPYSIANCDTNSERLSHHPQLC